MQFVQNSCLVLIARVFWRPNDQVHQIICVQGIQKRSTWNGDGQKNGSSHVFCTVAMFEKM